APGDGLDAATLRPALIQDSAERGDLHRQVAVLDDGSGPHRIHDLVPWDEVTRTFDENAEDFERPRADRQRNKGAALVAPEQAASGRPEEKPFDPVDVGGGECFHASASPESMSEANCRR